MPYTWNSLRFEPPAGLVDQTVVTFADSADAPSFSITIANDEKAGQAFAQYVEAQLLDLARALHGYTSSSRKDERINDRAAVVVEHRARSPQGQSMRQRQAYVDVGATIAIVTVTTADKHNAKADDAFDQIVKTLGG